MAITSRRSPFALRSKRRQANKPSPRLPSGRMASSELCLRVISELPSFGARHPRPNAVLRCEVARAIGSRGFHYYRGRIHPFAFNSSSVKSQSGAVQLGSNCLTEIGEPHKMISRNYFLRGAGKHPGMFGDNGREKCELILSWTRTVQHGTL